MISSDGFVPITAIFYAVFHPIQGTKIVHQVPAGSIASSLEPRAAGAGDALFNFDTVKNYIIPKPQLCNQLVSFKISDFRVLGYPVNIEAPGYSRNSFTFNFCFVLPYSSDKTPYESAVTRMGKMFRALEEQSHLLSKLDREQAFFSEQPHAGAAAPAHRTPGFHRIQQFSLSSVESLIHQIYQDLNNYSECCIPLDAANSVDIKLFPMLPPPVNLKAYQVPIPTVKLGQLMDVVWDPTMVKLLPYIDGLNSVKRISALAGADYLLTKQCIQHLMHYQCIILVDIFQFGSIYAPTNHIGNFLRHSGMAEECQAYIITAHDEPAPPQPPPPPKDGPSPSPTAPSPSAAASPASPRQPRPLAGHIRIPSKATLFFLYRSLNQGQTLKEWCIQHHKALANIDVRRFVNFGLVRGLIYRVHSYPILQWVTQSLETGDGKNESLESAMAALRVSVRRRAKSGRRRGTAPSAAKPGPPLLKSAVMESNLTTGKKARTVSFNYNVSRSSRGSSLADVPADSAVFSSSDESDVSESDDDEVLLKLTKLVRGSQHFDSICTELQIPRLEAEALLDKLGPHSLINA